MASFRHVDKEIGNSAVAIADNTVTLIQIPFRRREWIDGHFWLRIVPVSLNHADDLEDCDIKLAPLVLTSITDADPPVPTFNRNTVASQLTLATAIDMSADGAHKNGVMYYLNKFFADSGSEVNFLGGDGLEISFEDTNGTHDSGTDAIVNIQVVVR